MHSRTKLDHFTIKKTFSLLMKDSMLSNVFFKNTEHFGHKRAMLPIWTDITLVKLIKERHWRLGLNSYFIIQRQHSSLHW